MTFIKSLLEPGKDTSSHGSRYLRFVLHLFNDTKIRSIPSYRFRNFDLRNWHSRGIFRGLRLDVPSQSGQVHQLDQSGGGYCGPPNDWQRHSDYSDQIGTPPAESGGRRCPVSTSRRWHFWHGKLSTRFMECFDRV